ncbi:mini-chromosome maintenance complex-binding protein-like isoform X2 [Actinia tenebrosa]|uniref:Mini-chromosome maintenance complex-binding protein-like isoform X2 n=1 Tax=Actinia tenebrosa TaxID=6105 RepID=A0A6P8HIX5_ACTTE|nr:mini-chromosome maintenance complex-binding protein-like isoform X2 [Actinia tenebrosa]
MSLLILALVTLLRSSQGTPVDRCHDQSARYVYKPVFSTHKTWENAVADCQIQGVCLARPSSPSNLKTIQLAFLENKVHGKKMYWVGIKYDAQISNFKWDNDLPVTNRQSFSQITNLSEQKSPNFDKRCLAATRATKLEAQRCGTTMKYMCQIPLKAANTNAPFSVSTNIGNNGNNGNNGNGNNGNSGNKGNGKGNKQVESFVNGMKDLKPHNKDSLKNAMNLTTTLMKNIERGTKNGNEKSNFMKGALQLEKFSIEYAKQHINKTNKDPIRRNNERFVLEMRKVFTKPQKNLKFPEDLNRGEATIIELPASLFNVIKDSGIVMVSSLFTGVSDTLPTLTEDSSKKHLLISDVISSTLDPKPEGVLPENVTIILEHTNMSQPSSYKPKCVFWKFKVDNQFNGTWSSSGCTVKESNNNRTVCSCNHMTSFALLMQVDEQKTVSCMLLF